MFKRLFIIVSMLLTAATAGAQTYDGECTIRFFGDSTLHGFEGTAVCEPFSLNTEKETAIIRQPTVTVRVDSMDTDNDGRDEKMRKMFDSKSFPLIEANFADLEPEKVLLQMQAADDQPGTLPFRLKIRDQVQPVKAEVHDLRVNPEAITFTMKFSVSLKSYALEAPSVLGLIRVADQVEVEVDTTLQRQ
ncbi:MAG: hypothetical protein C0623_09285 [Desulfuromonas sp.]|nr:MAG: hypothetical protein C0623_09285 [Desulfuromonas sp.]